MTKSPKFAQKLIPCCILSAVILIAGIIVFAIFGFNVGQNAEYKTIAVKYDTYVTLSNSLREKLQDGCVAKAEEAGLTVEYTMPSDTTDGGMFEIILSSNADDAKIASAVASIQSFVTSDSELSSGEYAVASHVVFNSAATSFLWRSAIPAAILVVVAFVYAAIRYRLSQALLGLAMEVHNLLLLVALAALCRLPIGEAFVTSCLFVVLFSAVLSFILFHGFKTDFAAAESKALSAVDAVNASLKNSFGKILTMILVMGVGIVAVGAIAAKGMMLAMIPAFLAVLLCLYSMLFFLPSLLAKCKATTDKKDAEKRHYANQK